MPQWDMCVASNRYIKAGQCPTQAWFWYREGGKKGGHKVPAPWEGIQRRQRGQVPWVGMVGWAGGGGGRRRHIWKVVGGVVVGRGREGCHAGW